MLYELCKYICNDETSKLGLDLTYQEQRDQDRNQNCIFTQRQTRTEAHRPQRNSASAMHVFLG